MRRRHAVLLLPALAVLAVLTGCGAENALQGLTISARPTTMMALEAQRCVFLVQITHTRGAGPVTISVTAPNAVSTVSPASITGAQVCEVTVIPAASAVGTAIAVSIKGQQGSDSDTERQTIQVLEGDDTIGAYAATLRDQFVAWLEVNQPGSGITSATTWTGTIVIPGITDTAHYLFFSDDWEMGLAWRVAIPPGDWAQMYLRHRYTEDRPSYALVINSVAGGATPYPIGPPLWPYR